MSANDFWLSLVNLTTSALSGITGMGGGMILIGLMPLFLPASVIIPVHGATQLASNASRAWFGRESMDYRYLPSYLIGGLFGTLAFGLFVRFIDLEWIPAFIAIYILITQWTKRLSDWLSSQKNFYLIGFLQVGIGMFVGSPGPMHMPLLMKKYSDAHTAVSVASLMMSCFHVFKIIAYIWLGFAFSDYWQLIILLTISAVLGSWLGVRLRHIIPMPWLNRLIPWILTMIALYTLWHFGVGQGWI